LIAIPRSLARQFRAVLRRCGSRQDFSRDPMVLASSSGEGLALECVLHEAALRLDHPGKQEEGSIAFPASTLAQIEGRGDDEVTLEEISPEKGRAVWSEAGSTIIREFRPAPAERRAEFPRAPTSMISLGGDVLRALCDASQTAAQQQTARALDRVLLSGSTGRMIATDGRQLLIQDGFSFPFSEEVLIPALSVWGSKELPREEELLMGMGKEHLTVSIGPWTLALRHADRGRFPPAESIVPSPRGIKTRLRLSPEDVALLCKELSRLPAEDESAPAVEVVIGSEVVVRPCGGARNPSAELKLSGAQRRGEATRLVMNPRYLLRALKLGFTELEVVRPDAPVCCRDGHRVYVWMPHSDTAPAAVPAAPDPPNPLRKEMPSMPDNSGKHAHNGDATPPATFDLLAEAEEIRGLLHDAQSRLARLIGSLKQFRRQSRAVRAAVESLRDIPHLAP
jgi:hypothetical protein